MSSEHVFETPERFVVGTVGRPGERTFYLQVVSAGSIVTVALEKAELDANRYRQLYSRGAAARAELDNVESALQSAVATRDALKQSLEELTNGSRSEDVDQAMARAAEARASERLIKAGSRVEDIKAAKGEVEAAQGKLDTIKTLIDELVIKGAARRERREIKRGRHENEEAVRRDERHAASFPHNPRIG